MKNTLIIWLTFAISLSTYAQKKLLVIDSMDHVRYTIKGDDYIFFSYKGYLEKKDKFLGYVYSISGDTLFMYSNEPGENLLSSIFSSNTGFTKFLIKDITGIKKLWKHREYLQYCSYIGLFTLDLVLFGFLSRNNVGPEQAALTTFGVGLSAGLLVNIVSQPKIRIQISNQWRLKTTE